MICTKLITTVLIIFALTGCLDITRAREPKLQITSTIQKLEKKDCEFIFSDELYGQLYAPNTEMGMELERLKAPLNRDDRDSFERSISDLVLVGTTPRVKMIVLLKDLNGKTATEIISIADQREAEKLALQQKHRTSLMRVTDAKPALN